MKGVVSLLFVLSALVSQRPARGRRNAPLMDNGYDLLVGVSPDVKEDPQIIEELKQILTMASWRFYNGTNHRAFIKNVSILLPSSWAAKSDYQKVGKERYDDAEIVVAPENRKYGDAPYAKMLSTDCGAPGENIHLTPDYVVDAGGARQRFGDPGKVILHEWGHYRWGLQEEYPVPFGGLSSKFYFSMRTKKYEAVRCSLSTAGRILQPLGKNKYRICRLNKGMPDHEDCQFYPGFKIKNLAKVSVMDRQGTEQVDSFCEKSDDPLHEHNDEAPNRMNVLCGGKSAWEVMQEHADFKNDKNPPRNISRVDLTPNFKILHPGNDTKDAKCRVSLVIDRSGSMSGAKIDDLKVGLTNFIKYTVTDGMEIGMSSFNDAARIDCPMRAINGPADRDSFINGCVKRQSAGGGTDIADGVVDGVKNLRRGGTDAAGDRVFLLTDGADGGRGVDHPSVVNMLNQAQVFVDVVCFTKNADKRMKWLADTYGGKFYYDSADPNVNSLNDAFLKNPCGDAGSDVVTLLSVAGRLTRENNTVGGYFFIDESIGSGTKFLVNYGNGNGVVVNVTGPDGKSYTKDTPEYVEDSRSITISVPDNAIANVIYGKWFWKITGKRPGYAADYTMNVISRAKSSVTGYSVGNSVRPIVLKAHLKNVTAQFPAPMVVFAEATRGGDAVLNLKVEASVDRPKRSFPELPFRFPLTDDGLGADREKDDGVYSGSFAAYTGVKEGNNRYSFSVVAESADGQAAVKSYVSAGNWGSAPIIDENNLEVPTAPTFSLTKIKGGISRSAPAGAAELTPPEGKDSSKLDGELDRGEDLIAPSRIIDLEMASVITVPAVANQYLEMADALRLSWTAPGDDYNDGIVAYYSINMQTEDGTAATINVTKDVPPGKRVETTINLRKLGWNRTGVSATVTAIDDAGNESPKSNAASGYIEYAPLTGKNIGVIIGVVGAVVVAVAAGIILAVGMKMSKAKNIKVAAARRDEEGL